MFFQAPISIGAVRQVVGLHRSVVTLSLPSLVEAGHG